ncbi:T9SS type A sorting domain-containing protein [Subsaxibacter sp. CAU 1640]|uniref:T9SS type A sorting domain-containing protein n=1 Tax=Subsaxibacter sp. CAU 1640 TaxID=2933271 RepID=UPI002003ED22|nr:T9SS type A sorting domain-containing protein [Subsaxibacter sp. CAU 1640]MCK7589699.1 T9SS type A sorting domain-containing protein [Subsaxibacter sp. CAU 1640]
MIKKYTFVLSAFLCFSLFGFGQCLNDDFNSSYGNWGDGSGTYQNAAAGRTGNGTGFNSTNDDIITSIAVTNPTNITFWLARSSNTSNKTLSVQYSTSNTGPWTNVRDILNGEVTETHQLFTTNLNLTGNYYLRIVMSQRSGGSYYLDDVIVNCGPSGPTITVTQASGGTITPGTTSVTSGSNQSFTAAPDSCHTFSNWIVDGVNVGNANPYTFNNVTADHNITAVYNTNSYAITASAGIDGSITPNGVTNVFCGNDQTYTFTPDSGYVVDDVLVDGVSQGPLSSYTFNSVSSNHTIYVTFIFYVGPCLSDDFDTGYGNWSGGTGTYQNATAGNTGNGTGFNSTNDDIITSGLVSSPDYMTFNARTSGTGANFTISFQYSATGGAPWSTAATINANGSNTGNVTTTASNFTIPLSLTGDYYLRIIMSARSGGSFYLDDVNVFCGTCVPTVSVSSFAPSSGPVGTYVTITGTGFTGATTVDFNGTPVINYVSQTATELIVEVPAGTVTGPISVDGNSCPVQTSDFNIIDNAGSCGGINDLIMTEIYDQNGGSLGYIEVFNGTNSTINLANYFIRRYGDAVDFAINDYVDYFFAPEITSIASGQVIYGRISTSANTASPNFNYTNTGFAGINGDDIFHLYNGSTIIDVYTIPDSGIGYVARRNTNTAGPNNTENPGDWSFNTTENTSNLGVFNYTGAVSNFPSITTHPNDVSGCASEAEFTAIASPGNGGTLSYQWYFNDGTATGWTLVTSANLPLTTVSGETTNQLLLTDGFYNYDGYQFYCLVTEDGSCSTATDATQLLVPSTIWDGTIWLSGAPNISTIAIIDGDYDTSVGGQQSSFSACQLLVNGGYTLFIEDGDYVEVENNLTANGEIIVRTSGSFKQNNDAGLVNGAVLSTPSLVKVEKETAPLNAWYEYTYWSSPVANETVGVALGDSNPNRRFWYDAQNYLDATMETNNDNGSAPGQDDIDDDANDWTFAPAGMTMTPGVGFGATHSSTGFSTPGNQYKYTFQGPFNNGVYNVPLYRNDAELNDNNWNLIGNPYPSAISADALLAANTVIDMNVPGGVIDGAIFLWSQNVAPDGSTNGNENLNFAQSDYAIINGTGQAAGGDGVTPNRYIPSGQAFFVSMSNSAPSTVVSGTTRTADFVFNNSMRVLDNNDQFFRNAQGEVPNKLWVDLTSDNGVFNQILVGYVNGATDANDGMYYDALKNLSIDANAILYSRLNSDDTDLKFGIQGKHPNSLSIDESIPLGFSNSITEATIFKLALSKLEGDFLLDNNIYLIDHLLNTIHNLKQEDYSFVSEVGEFNDRFEIVFQNEALSVVENEITPNGLSIVELNDGTVRFTVSNNLTIESVQIFDLLGRALYELKGSAHSETFDLSNLSQSAYIAKVTLSNGQTISKRAVKRK